MASGFRVPRDRKLTVADRKALRFTRSGYVIGAGCFEILSCVRIPGPNGSSFQFVKVPHGSVSVASRVSEASQEIPLNVIASMLYKIGLGQKRCPPTFQHPFVGTYNKTFFTTGYSLSFTDAYTDLLCLSAYGTYVQTRYWDKVLGISEPVYREARVVQANLAMALLRALKRGDADALVPGAPGDPGNRSTKPARGDNVGEWMPYAYLKELGDVIKTDDDALAYVFGLQAIGTLKDYRPKPTSKGTPPRCVRYLRALGVPEDIPEDVRGFATMDVVRRVIATGKSDTSPDFVIPCGSEEILDTSEGSMDILSSELGEQPWHRAPRPAPRQRDEDEERSPFDGIARETDFIPEIDDESVIEVDIYGNDDGE